MGFFWICQFAWLGIAVAFWSCLGWAYWFDWTRYGPARAHVILLAAACVVPSVVLVWTLVPAAHGLVPSHVVVDGALPIAGGIAACGGVALVAGFAGRWPRVNLSRAIRLSGIVLCLIGSIGVFVWAVFAAAAAG